MTIHGLTAVDFARLGATEYVGLKGSIEKRGIVVSSENTQIDGHADHQGEYVNVFHSADYIRRAWTRHFHLVDILPGYIFTHDLVIMRK